MTPTYTSPEDPARDTVVHHSRPVWENPRFLRELRRSLSDSPENAVPSIRRPSSDPTFPPRHLQHVADGHPAGGWHGVDDQIRGDSGLGEGMSSWGAMRPIDPFLAVAEANLSPTSAPADPGS